MSESKIKNSKYETKLSTRIAYGVGTLADNLSLQNFTFLGFSFYFAVVGLPVWIVSIGYIIYSLWDAIDDPLIGVLSDRTKTRWGRRKPWIWIATIPLCLLMIFIWTPPTGNQLFTFIYYVGILILFDLVFTTYTVNFNGLWPEMFLTNEDRSSVGIWRSVFTIIGLIFAFLLPEVFIEDIANVHGYPYTMSQFVLNGAVAAIIVLITIAIMLKWGSFERKEFSKDVEGAPKWKESFKITFKNKAFMIYSGIALAIFIVYGILPIMMPFYVIYILNMEDPGLVILLALLSSAAFTPLWMKLRNKWGVRKSYMFSVIFWAASLILFMFAFDEITGYLFVLIMGIGLGGSLYLYDQGIAEVIDDDEVRSGIDVRREGAYYGVVALFNRLSGAINLLVIAIVFSGTGWGEWEFRDESAAPITLRLLVIVWPILILLVALVLLYFWPIHGDRLEENKRKLAELHAKKRGTTS
ncbi:MAG: MFS transporter [Candidatus Hodarchaeota archaeon]